MMKIQCYDEGGLSCSLFSEKYMVQVVKDGEGNIYVELTAELGRPLYFRVSDYAEGYRLVADIDDSIFLTGYATIIKKEKGYVVERG